MFLDRLTKRFFFITTPDTGRKEETIMRRMMALILALVLVLSMTACSGSKVKSGVEDGVLTVAMECAYAPYNWAQTDDSNGAVPSPMWKAPTPTATV